MEIEVESNGKTAVVLPDLSNFEKDTEGFSQLEKDIILGLIYRHVKLNFQEIHHIYLESDNEKFKKLVEDYHGVYPVKIEDMETLVREMAGETEKFNELRQQYTYGKYM